MADKPEPEVLPVAPAMPTGSVDFNALNDAIAAGKSAEEALAESDLTPRAQVEKLEDGVTHPDATGEAALDSLPGLKGKAKADLLAIAAEEKALIAEGVTTNADIIAAIEANRDAIANGTAPTEPGAPAGDVA